MSFPIGSRERLGLSRSNIDTNRFGFSVARAYNPASEKEVSKIIQFCRRGKFHLCIVRLSAERIQVAGQLNRRGFFLTDTLATWVLTLSMHRGMIPPKRLPIRPANPHDIDRLMTIARTAFQHYSGHYHNDPMLPRKAVAQIYPDWIRRSAQARESGRVVLIAASGRTLTGFAALRRCSPFRVVVDLVAVHPRFQRQGYLQALLNASSKWAREKGARELAITTLLTNIAVQKTCVRLGFTLQESSYTFHGWFRS